MERGKKIRMLLMVMLLAAGLLVGAEVMAQSGPCPPYPTSCNFQTAAGATTGFSLAMIGGAPTQVPCPTGTVYTPDTFPSGGTGWIGEPGAGPCYSWTYGLTGDIKQVNQIVGLLPNCCNVSYFVTSNATIPNNTGLSGCVQLQALGTGDSTSRFGAGDYQNFVIRNVPNAGSTCGSFTVITNKLTPLRHMSFQLKSGGSYVSCRDMEGPACLEQCPVPGFVPVNITEEKQVGKDGENLIRITRNHGNWCAQKVEFYCTAVDERIGCSAVGWMELFPEPITLDGTPNHLINCGTADGNQRCQECLIYSNVTPCTYYTSGGQTYKVPKGCPIP